VAVTGWLDRLAATAPVPVAVARGLGGHRALAHLRADAGIRVVDSPRHATLLVVVGAIPHDHLDALAVVHDQVPAPRGVATVGLAGDTHALGLGELPALPDGDPTAALRSLQRDVLAGLADRPALGRAEHPVKWQGVGPHGQGGEGMMGGTPYGRMMPMPPTEGRDGLALDRLSLRLGPFLPGLPPGVTLDVGLQGDVLEDVDLVLPALDDPPVGAPNDTATDPALRANEVGRLLVALAELCQLVGLGALARRVARVALDPDPAGVEMLRRRLDRPWALRAATDGVGVLDDGSDVTDRWRAWLERSAAALDGHPLDPPPPLDPAQVAEVLRGQELGRAWLTLCSLAPELEPTVPAPTATTP